VTNVLYADIAGYAATHGLPVEILKIRMNEPGLLETVQTWKPDVFLVAGWYHMIPNRWRAVAPAYGLHASLLPDYSGGAPLVWAMINGEAKAGITLFQMDSGVDSGLIAGQAEEIIHPNDTIATLYSRIEERGLDLLRDFLPRLADGTFTLTPQDESKRRIFPQRSPEDGHIDWSQDARAIDRFIRAQTKPYPGAFGILEGERLTIWSADLDVCSPADEPGRIEKNGEKYSVCCAEGRVILKEIAYRGKDYLQPDMHEVFSADHLWRIE
jgi:methionyl-tRNA formyltransferase